MQTLDSGCENPFALGSDKGRRAASLEMQRGLSESCQPGHPCGLTVLLTHFLLLAYLSCFIFLCSGFSVCLDPVKRLPHCETKTFEVCFDPQSANLPLGKVDVLLPFKVLQLLGQAAGWAQQRVSAGLSAGCSVLL